MTVKPRGRLVQKQQQVWSCGELDPDGDALSLLGRQAARAVRLADDCIGNVLHFQHGNHILDETVFVFSGHIVRLAQVGGESQSLPYGLFRRVYVGLSRVPGAPRESLSGGLAVDEYVA